MKEMMKDELAAPNIVDRSAFQAELDALRVRKKAHTHEGDAIAAARRRLPMVEVPALDDENTGAFAPPLPVVFVAWLIADIGLCTGTLATICRMPLTVFDIKGVSGNRRERIEAAVVTGGKEARGPHEAWIAADPFKGSFRVLITGPQGFERSVMFALADDPAVIAERVRETLEE